MRPMSLYESGDSTGEVSLQELFDGKLDIDGESNLNIDRLAFLIARGGWPLFVEKKDTIALDQAFDYYDNVVHYDINRVDNVQKNPEKVKRLMRSYARNQGSQVPNTQIALDISANDESSISEETIASYGLIEIKLGGDKLIEEGAKSLKTMERKINTDKMNSPSFLMILTGIGDYAYKRKDGILVVPIGSLKN